MLYDTINQSKLTKKEIENYCLFSVRKYNENIMSNGLITKNRINILYMWHKGLQFFIPVITNGKNEINKNSQKQKKNKKLPKLINKSMNSCKKEIKHFSMIFMPIIFKVTLLYPNTTACLLTSWSSFFIYGKHRKDIPYTTEFIYRCLRLQYMYRNIFLL